MIVAYKFGIQKGGALSAAEGIKVHYLHAEANDGKVLLTMGRFPRAEYRDVEDLSKIDLFAPPEQYTVPSIWNDETSEEVAGWFALKNLREIKINPGDFTATSGKDLLDSLDSRAYMIYCERTKK